jgi:hypothetical protein
MRCDVMTKREKRERDEGTYYPWMGVLGVIVSPHERER